MDRITSPRDLLRLLRQRIRLFLVTAGLAAIVVLLASQLLPLQYTGVTEFERRVDPAAEEVMKSRSQSFGAWKLTLEKELISEARIVDVLVKLKRLDPRDSTRKLSKEESLTRRELLDRVSQNLRIDWRLGNEQIDRVALSYTDSDPELAWQIPQGLVEEYGTHVSQQIKDNLTQSCSYYDARITDSEKTLERVRADRVAFQAANAGRYPEPGAYSQRVVMLLTESQGLQPQLDMAHQREAQLLLLMNQPASQPTSGPAREVMSVNLEYQRLDEELHRVRGELGDALIVRGLKDKHPIVVALKKKIADLESQFKQTPRTQKVQEMFPETPPYSSMQLQFDLAATRASMQQLSSRLAKVQGELDELQKNVAVYTRVAQEYADKCKQEADWTEKIRVFQLRQNDLQLQLNAEISQRGTRQATLRYATRPYEPSSPKLWMILVGAVLASLGAGAGMTFLAGFFDRTVRQPESAERQFDVPVHGVIGEIVTQQERRARRKRTLVLTPIVAIVLLAIIAFSLWMTAIRVLDNEKYRRFLHSPLQALAVVDSNVDSRS